jgi:hypothetical protein
VKREFVTANLKLEFKMNKNNRRQVDHTGGRPNVAKGVRKDYVWSTRVNEIENDLLLERCERTRLNKSQYVYRSLFEPTIKERLNSEQCKQLKQLAGMGNNLNQIARRANADGYGAAAAEVQNISVDIANLISEIRKS